MRGPERYSSSYEKPPQPPTPSGTLYIEVKGIISGDHNSKVNGAFVIVDGVRVESQHRSLNSTVKRYEPRLFACEECVESIKSNRFQISPPNL